MPHSLKKNTYYIVQAKNEVMSDKPFSDSYTVYKNIMVNA